MNIKNPIITTWIKEIQELELSNINNLESIVIEGNFDYFTYHYEANFTKKLKYSKNQLIGKDDYNTTRKRKVIFELEK